MNTILLLGLVAAALVMAAAALPLYQVWRRRNVPPEAAHHVSHDAEQIVHRLPDGTVERICWDELSVVEVMTTDQGPAVCDWFWVLQSRNGEKSCLVPQGATGELALLERLQQLPEFDNPKLVEALASTDNHRFLIWRRPGLDPTPS